MTDDVLSDRDDAVGGSRAATGCSPLAEGAPGTASATTMEVPPPEVRLHKKRRNHTAQYKLKILALATQCKKNGELGELLRREGLYSSCLTKWRKQRDEGLLHAPDNKRGRKAQESSALIKEKKRLERENAKLKAKLEEAEIIIDFQKKTSQMLALLDKKEEKKS